MMKQLGCAKKHVVKTLAALPSSITSLSSMEKTYSAPWHSTLLVADVYLEYTTA